MFVMDRGQSLIIPLLFDRTNYAYWKVRMRAFLQSLDEKVWQAVEIGWTKPKEAPADWDDANNVEIGNNNVKNDLASENLDKGKSILGAPPKLEKKNAKNPKAKKATSQKPKQKKQHLCYHCGIVSHTRPNCYK